MAIVEEAVGFDVIASRCRRNHLYLPSAEGVRIPINLTIKKITTRLLASGDRGGSGGIRTHEPVRTT